MDQLAIKLNRAARPSVLALIVICSAIFLQAAPAAVLDPRTVQSATLYNGLRLVVCEDRDATVVSVEVIVKVGAADDPPDQRGIAHLLEHLLWAAGGEDDPRLRMEQVGGVTNAGTLRDYTRFYATVPSGYLQLALETLGEVVLRKEFDEATIARERRIIVEEGAASREDPRAVLSDLAFDALYAPSHPYGRPIDGDEGDIAGIGSAKLALFHQTWYVPNNMAVVVAGDVEFEAARAGVTQVFGACLPAAVPRRLAPIPARPADGGERVAELPIEKACVMAAFIGPSALEHTEVCASDLLATLLADNLVGRLAKELRENSSLAASVDVDFLTQRDRALFGVWAVCEPDKVPEVKRAIRRELGRLAAEPIPGEELAVAKRLLSAGYGFANETPADRALTLGFYEAVDSYRTATYYLPRVRHLSEGDVRRTAAWYAGEPFWIVLRPEADEE